jgi:SHS family lactate transporter-like MFS transporter
MSNSLQDLPSIQYESHASQMSIGKYAATRITTLTPPLARVPNPFRLLGLLNRKQWLFFLVAFCGWTWDSFDFFTVSLTIPDIAKSFNKTNADITWGITVVLMLRSVGSIFFGIAADRYGRKWPFVVNLMLFVIFELCTGFCQTYHQFLGCRALFGISMGGLYGNTMATALEDCPEAARGILSGLMQQGYSLGYLLATVFARFLVNTTAYGWRPLFWFGACPPMLVIIFRLSLPETEAFYEREKLKRARGNLSGTFFSEGKVALKHHWLLLIYLVLLMAGFNFMSHGSQDLYPTMLQVQYKYSPNAITITQVIANVGAITGGVIIGYSSQIFGRRFSIIFITIVGACLLYPYSFTSSKAIVAAAFFEQFCVQGAWGVIPVHLMELSPGSFRTFVVGTSHSLGNLISCASSTIEATISERFPLPSQGSTQRYRYNLVICIFMGCVYAFVILLVFVGPESRGREMGINNNCDLADVIGVDAATQISEDREEMSMGESGSETIQKGVVREIETV